MKLKLILSISLTTAVLLSSLSACSATNETVTSGSITSGSQTTSTAYSTVTSSSIIEMQTTESVAPPAPELLYFKTDATVNDFFVNYNNIAEYTVSADIIKKGNIRTKALVYSDNYNMTVINAHDFLSISMSCAPKNENSLLLSIFKDAIMAMRSGISENDIENVWEEIHKSGYLVEDYQFNDITITYVPSKELSWGTSNLRIDINIPLEQ